MSWFADLAGRAEDFLNKVDQGAATALTRNQAQAGISSSSFSYNTAEPVEASSQYTSAYRTPALEEQQHSYHSSHESSGFISTAAGNIKKSKGTLLTGTANTPLAQHGPASSSSQGGSASSKATANFVRPKKPELDDDLLFDFLNSSDPAIGGKKDAKWERPRTVGGSGEVASQVPPASSASQPPLSASSSPRSTHGLSRTSSLSSLSNSVHSVKTSEDGSAKEQSQDTPESSDSGLAGPQEPAVEEPAPVEEPQSQVISSLRLENQLLRNEVASLNQEMATVIQRAKDTQEELALARARTEKWNSDQSRTDRTVRELRSQVDDLMEALSAKDGQLAVLKVRLDEADQLLKSRNSALEAAENEKIRILQDHTEGSNLHSQALQTLQERLREAESALKREQDSYRKMQNEFAERLSKVEGERQTLAETVMDAERRGSEDRRRAEELQQQAKSARTAAETAKQELQDYKHKASRILQSKEKLISSLKEGSGLEALEVGGAGALELEELRHEKELQRDEIQKLQAQVQTLRAEIQEVQEQQAALARAKQEVEAELERCKQELQYMEEEQHRAKSTLQSRIKDREEEIQKLRNQLTNKTLSSSSQVELESRLHQLTETLIQKQTMLEALGTEKSSLVFQLERLEQQLKSVQGGQANGPAINMGNMEAPGARLRNVPVLFSDHDGPGAGMYGKVRKAASTIDRFSIRLGIFLRRYPMARVFVILYMVRISVC
ncbi:hypothetical protein JZ751_003110 [Albula glossodonta]|uniref:Golgin subfamily A member 5 n=1 Tax=Albula glossodonta TaxID=121402 RepID=A0A8T2NGE9_9TELE|nr:hypothetical protein JZ751_003110 [Albula glossodonta]